MFCTTRVHGKEAETLIVSTPWDEFVLIEIKQILTGALLHVPYAKAGTLTVSKLWCALGICASTFSISALVQIFFLRHKEHGAVPQAFPTQRQEN